MILLRDHVIPGRHFLLIIQYQIYYPYYKSTLRVCSLNNHRSIVRLLLEPKYNLKNSGDHEEAILDATHLGHVDLVQLLLEKGTLFDIQNLQRQMLWLSSRRGHLPLVLMVLEAGVDVNAKESCGTRAIEYAAMGGHESVVSLLLKKGANLDYDGGWKDAINEAASSGHEQVVQILLDHGADVNSSGFRDVTPLFEATKAQQANMVRFLLDRGADLNVNESGEYSFSHAVSHGFEEIVRILAKEGVNIDSTGYEGEPAPILSAIMCGQDKMVRTLLELGAKWVDPMESAWGKKFLDGTYPSRPPPQKLLDD